MSEEHLLFGEDRMCLFVCVVFFGFGEFFGDDKFRDINTITKKVGYDLFCECNCPFGIPAMTKKVGYI